MQFALTAPTGSLSMKSFQDVLFDLAALSQGMEQVPDFWINLSQDKVQRNDPQHRNLGYHVKSDKEIIYFTQTVTWVIRIRWSFLTRGNSQKSLKQTLVSLVWFFWYLGHV